MQNIYCAEYTQGRSQEFVSEGDKPGSLGTEVPRRGLGLEPRWGSGGYVWGRSPQKLKTYMLITIAIMC